MSRKNKTTKPSRWKPIGLVITLGVMAVIGVLIIVGWSYVLGASSPAPVPVNQFQSQDKRNEPAPDFAIQTIDGQAVSLAQEKGKVLGLFFMAGWCTSCQPEAHSWGQLYAKYHDKGLDVLIVDVQQGEGKDDVLAFKARTNGGNHWWALDQNLGLVEAFRVQALDTTYIIGRDGRVVYYDYWPTSADVLEREVGKALQ